MHLDPLGSTQQVDTKTAEEALKLAARLQAEHGDKVSLDELHRTASEAGINSAYLNAALAQIQQQQSPKTGISDAKLLGIFAAMAMVFIAFVVIMTAEHGPPPKPIAAILVMFAMAIIFGIVMSVARLMSKRTT
jgi:hypothetical protein